MNDLDEINKKASQMMEMIEKQEKELHKKDELIQEMKKKLEALEKK